MVEHLYDAALQESSQQTYRTGQRAYLRFVEEVRLGGSRRADFLQPFTQKPLNTTELSLAFFIAYLVLQPSITASSTILSYESHVKYKFREHGCDAENYKTPFLGQLRRGVENVFPQQADAKRPFILPKYISRQSFICVDPRNEIMARFATIVGFIGMLRPHTLKSLRPSSIIFVTWHGEERQITTTISQDRLDKISGEPNLGFYIKFKSKTMTNARAYYPNLSTPESNLAAMCPVRALKDIMARGLMKNRSMTGSWCQRKLRKYLRKLSASESEVPLYALRIGGRTWHISHGLDRQFVDYLGTWKSPESSARYFRGNPSAVLKKLRAFYYNIKDPWG